MLFNIPLMESYVVNLLVMYSVCSYYINTTDICIYQLFVLFSVIFFGVYFCSLHNQRTYM